MPEKRYLYLLLAVLSIPVLWALDGSYVYGLGVFYASGVDLSSALYAQGSLLALLLLSPVIVFARNFYRKAKGKLPDFSYSTSFMVVLLGVVIGFFAVIPGTTKWQLHREAEHLKALYRELRTASTSTQVLETIKDERFVRWFGVKGDKDYLKKNNLTLTEGIRFTRLSYPSGNAFMPRKIHIFVSMDKASERVLAVCFAENDILDCE